MIETTAEGGLAQVHKATGADHKANMGPLEGRIVHKTWTKVEFAKYEMYAQLCLGVSEAGSGAARKNLKRKAELGQCEKLGRYESCAPLCLGCGFGRSPKKN
jgi:hypothetical protein